MRLASRIQYIGSQLSGARALSRDFAGHLPFSFGTAVSMKYILVAGARPNFMKVAPIMEAFRIREQKQVLLVHTGQHYDDKMSDNFFADLQIPKPDLNL